MPEYDRQTAHDMGLVQPPTPDEEERVAILAAAQYTRGLATPGQALEAMRMLGVEDAAIGISSRRHAYRGDKERGQAVVLELKIAKRKRRRRAS